VQNLESLTDEAARQALLARGFVYESRTMNSAEQIVENAAKKVQSKVGGERQAAIDPAFLLMLVDLIVTVLKNCRESSPQAVEAAAKRGGFIQRLRLRRLVRQSMTAAEWRSHGGDTVQAMLEAAAESDDGEIASVAEAASMID
jgi:hypothetical protein